MSSRDVTVILHPASAIYSNQDTAATGEMSLDQDYLGARGASRLECAEKTDRTERRRRRLRRRCTTKSRFPQEASLSLSFSVSLFFVFRVSSQVGPNEGTDL